MATSMFQYVTDAAEQRTLLANNLNDIGVGAEETELLDSLAKKISMISGPTELGDVSKSWDLGDYGVTSQFYGDVGVLVIDGTNATEGYNYIPDYTSSTMREFYTVEEEIKYVMLNNITGIGMFSLADMPNCLMIYDLTSTVTDVNDYGCYCNESLLFTNVFETVTGIGNFGFAGCTALTVVTGGSVECEVGANAFANCSDVSAIIIAASSIDEYAFANCSSLRYLSTESFSATEYPEYMCAGCSALTEFYIPSLVTDIADTVIYYCYGLTKISTGYSEGDITIPSTNTSQDIEIEYEEMSRIFTYEIVS